VNILEPIGRKIPAGRILSRSYGLIYPGELAEAKGFGQSHLSNERKKFVSGSEEDRIMRSKKKPRATALRQVPKWNYETDILVLGFGFAGQQVCYQVARCLST